MGKVKTEDSALRAQTLETADRLHSAAIHLLRLARKYDVALGVGPSQLSALSVLVFAGPKTLGELAAAEQVKPPTMSRIVSGLKRGLFVEISRDPRDIRRMHIQPTRKGKRLLQKGRQRRINDLANQLSTLSAGKLTQLESAIAVLETLFQHWC